MTLIEVYQFLEKNQVNLAEYNFEKLKQHLVANNMYFKEEDFSSIDLQNITRIIPADAIPPLKQVLTDNLVNTIQQGQSPYKKAVLAFLSKYDLISYESANLVLRTYVDRLYEALNILDSKNKVEGCRDAFQKFFANFSNTYSFSFFVIDLNNANLLDEKLVNKWIEVENANKAAFLRLIFSYIKAFATVNNIEDLLNLSLGRLKILYAFIENTIATQGKLTEMGYTLGFKRITQKLPPVEPSIVTEIKGDAHTYTQIAVDGQFSFFVSKKIPLIRKFSRVEKGLDSPLDIKPSWAIKETVSTGTDITHPPSEKEKQDNIKQAKQEVKIRRLFDEPAFFYMYNGKAHALLEWYKGKKLEKITRADLENIPYIDRFKAIVYFLERLNKLHKSFRVHIDIKQENMIWDLEKKQLHLLDFAGSHRQGSSKNFTYSPGYIQDKKAEGTFNEDMWLTGGALSRLWQEIYVERESPTKIFIDLVKKPSYAVEEAAAYSLIESMRRPLATDRCTSEEALQYCQQVVSHLENGTLTKPILEKMAVDLLDQPKEAEVTIEQLLHGKRKLLMQR